MYNKRSRSTSLNNKYKNKRKKVSFTKRTTKQKYTTEFKEDRSDYMKYTNAFIDENA